MREGGKDRERQYLCECVHGKVCVGVCVLLSAFVS